MPRRVASGFKNGMVSDSPAEDSLFQLHDAYIRRDNEICTRGPITKVTGTSLSTGTSVGYHAIGFHPNFGVGISRAITGGAQLIGAGLQSGSTALAFSYATENGAGSTKSQVAANCDASIWASYEISPQTCNSGDEMIFAGQEGNLFKWGGSTQPSISAGTVTIESSVAGSKIVTCSAANWTNAEAGQYIMIQGIATKANTQQRAFLIKKVHSTTVIEIETDIYHATTYTGLLYRIQSVALIQSPDGIWNPMEQKPTQIGVVAYHGIKLWTAGVADAATTDYDDIFNYDRVRYSGTPIEIDADNKSFRHLDLWHDLGFVDVFPGIGGRIQGLVSFRNELIVIKSHAMFRIIGQTNYKGDGGSISVQIISETIGAEGIRAWCQTKDGLVVANADGMFIYDGSEVTSLTNERIQTWWNSNYRTGPFEIMSFNDKLIVQRVGMTKAVTPSVIWDIDRHYFWTATLPENFSSGITVYNEQDQWRDQISFAKVDSYGPDISYWKMHNMNSLLGVVTGSDTGVALPKPDIITHPFPLAEDASTEGRINNVYIHAMMTDSLSAEFPVFLESGSTDDSNVSYTQEYGIIVGTTDRVHRVAVDGMDPCPTSRVRIKDSIGGKFVRIYSIGVDYEAAAVQGPTS